jgi:putative acyl-CoA dehydrogenase
VRGTLDSMGATHEVFNQTPPLYDYDMAAADPVLLPALEREGAGWASDRVTALGRRMSSEEVTTWGFLANEYTPRLRTHDRVGNRSDTVDFHPAWHGLMGLAISNGLHSIPWEKEPGEGGFPARAALTFIASQIEAGHFCPISMTCGAVPTIRLDPGLASFWEPKAVSREYDPTFAPATDKPGVLVGMGMTEKQGGSDVRANTTRAVPTGVDGEYLLTGHKWFMSAPMCDAFLVLAQAPGGLSCFLVPRFNPDGKVNALRLQRLKDKLGNRSNASSEVEFDGAFGWMVGEEGRGVSAIIEMVGHTRLDCATGSAALMRQAVTQAIHHVRHRSAFGSPLIEKPLMRNVLADLEVETEAAVLLMMRVAGAFDRAATDDHEDLVKRLLTPVAKYWVTKRCSEVTREAMECLGGNGYVEESIMPRLYRESPVNAIWEGSGNVIALDILRVLVREPAAVKELQNEVEEARGHDPRLDRAIDAAFGGLDLSDAEAGARIIIERMALATSGALLARYASPEVYEAFAVSRLDGDWGHLFGTLPTHLDFGAIIEPAIPEARA